MLRLSTTTYFAWSTVRIEIPKIGLDRSLRAVNARLGEQHLHVSWHPAGDGVVRVRDLPSPRPLLSSRCCTTGGFQTCARPRMLHPPLPREERSARQLIVQVEDELAVLHEVEDERRNVAAEELTCVGGVCAGQVQGAADLHAVGDHVATRLREGTVPTLLGGQIHDHRSR